MKNLFLTATLLTASILMAAAFGQSEAQRTGQEDVVASFRQYIQKHLDSYKADRRERVTFLGGGWAKEYYEAVGDHTIDVQTTNSLVSPYIGVCEFSLRRHLTAFHARREDATKDDSFVKSDDTMHRHRYAFQDGKWIPKLRENMSKGLDKWYDCDEVISFGPDQGETNIYGCWEKAND